jgi:hypothetical protein
MVFYLFRPRASLNGIPFPCSAHYRLWIQPGPRRRAGSSSNTQGSPEQAAPVQNTASRSCGQSQTGGKKEESPLVWAFSLSEGGVSSEW